MQPSSNSKPTNPKIQNFLESLRQRSLSNPELPTRANINSIENYQEKRKLEQQRKQEFFRARSKEFKEVYSLTKKKEQARIDQLVQELRSLAASMRNLKKEVDVAVNQKPLEVGEYQLTVLEHLRITIEILKKDVDQASSWMHVFNTRKTQRSYYWAMAQAKGTKFTMSEERGIATSIG